MSESHEIRIETFLVLFGVFSRSGGHTLDGFPQAWMSRKMCASLRGFPWPRFAFVYFISKKPTLYFHP